MESPDSPGQIASSSTVDCTRTSDTAAAAATTTSTTATTAAAVELDVSPAEKLQHLVAFLIPTLQKRPPFPCSSVDFDIERGVVIISGDTDRATAWERWSKVVEKECKKIVVEDLGKMDGHEGVLLNTAFSEAGWEKMAKHELEEKIKVVFRKDGHVLLVGAKAKLEKKAVPIRTLLGHFHWRLSGQYQGQAPAM
ncbi:unnamed protein product [Polarella glacialis]|uniref:Uncharacterized protein n=1 Tax=Polarella glacialis TaxID=89957 RepID=A0A813GCA1_POLGL|nr:unnamed protein product [Polarella glacialis]CAE8683657.1 unnamed protein product [Polarella glacialis]